MSEFSFSDICRWMEIAYDHDCSIGKAIYYDLYFKCQNDATMFNRADHYFRQYLKDKLGYVEKVGVEGRA